MKNTVSIKPKLLLYAFLVLPFVLGACSKEKRAEKNIAGSWKAVSISETGSEIMNVWLTYSYRLYCNSGGYFTVTDKWQHKEFTMDFGDGGIVSETLSTDFIDTDTTETEKTCKPVSKPQYSVTEKNNYLWEISEKGKTLTLEWASGNGNNTATTEYEILEITDKVLRLKRKLIVQGEYFEYKLEKQ